MEKWPIEKPMDESIKGGDEFLDARITALGKEIENLGDMDSAQMDELIVRIKDLVADIPPLYWKAITTF